VETSGTRPAQRACDSVLGMAMTGRSSWRAQTVAQAADGSVRDSCARPSRDRWPTQTRGLGAVRRWPSSRERPGSAAGRPRRFGIRPAQRWNETQAASRPAHARTSAAHTARARQRRCLFTKKPPSSFQINLRYKVTIPKSHVFCTENPVQKFTRILTLLSHSQK